MPSPDGRDTAMSHATQLLAILDRERRRQATAGDRRARLARLRRPVRDCIERAEATIERNRQLRARAGRLYRYFATPRPRPDDDKLGEGG